MAPPHNSSTRAAERRKQRRQRRSQQGSSAQRTSAAPKMAPLTLDDRKRGPRVAAVAAPMLDPEAEYQFVRRDLWRLVVFTAICFALMMAVLFLLEG